MAVITISRQFGAGANTLARQLAKTLDYRWVDREIIKEVAERAGVSQSGVQAAEKSAGSWLMGLVDRIFSKEYIDRVLAEETHILDEKEYIELVTRIVEELAQEDNAIVVGRGGQFILRDRPGVFHVLLAADFDFRVDYVSRWLEIDKREAEEKVRAADKRRESYLRAFDPGDVNDPGLYHLTINTSMTGLTKAEQLVLELIK